MPFQKGQSGNINGRPKGSKNIKTEEIRAIINEVIASSFKKSIIEKDLRDLAPKQRLEYLLRLVEFILSKPRSFAPEELNKQETMAEKHKKIVELFRNTKISSQE